MRNLLGGWALMLLMAVSVAAGNSDAASDLHSIFADQQTYSLQANPIRALGAEKREYVTSLGDVSAEQNGRFIAKYSEFLDRLGAVDRTALTPDDQLNYDIFSFMLNQQITKAHLRDWRIPFFADSGFHTSVARLSSSFSFKNADDYELYLKLLSDIPRYFDQHRSNMRLGMETGFTMPKVALDGLLPTFKAYTNSAVEDSSFYTPFKTMPNHFDEAEKAALREKAVDVISSQVYPAYNDLNSFIMDVYYPAAKEAIGASAWQDGMAHYDTLVGHYTSMDITADEVHEIGLAEVARIRAEMEQVIDDTGFEGGFAAFIDFLRTDEQFYARTAEELIKEGSYIAKLIDAKMPSLFKVMARQPYGVEPVPDAIAPNYTTGRYVPAPKGSTRAGTYWINTYNLDKRPLYVIPALTLHEGVPGHHHQLALAAEMENVPAFRTSLRVTAYSEGWGLYSEKLGLDMGIYRTPYEQFGRLSYEMWRAARLVVDTGMHAKGWTRAEAIKLMEDNSALSKHNIRTEVDRYISWPGQSLGYKMGEISIIKLREKAEETLGGDFDIRAFHDHLLATGAVPIPIMETRMHKWIADQAGHFAD